VPVYEFKCQKCGKEFTVVLSVKQYEQKEFACPDCKAGEVERLITSAQVITSKKS
jgi:putative FmdB family regulatory protein